MKKTYDEILLDSIKRSKKLSTERNLSLIKHFTKFETFDYKGNPFYTTNELKDEFKKLINNNDLNEGELVRAKKILNVNLPQGVYQINDYVAKRTTEKEMENFIDELYLDLI